MDEFYPNIAKPLLTKGEHRLLRALKIVCRFEVIVGLTMMILSCTATYLSFSLNTFRLYGLEECCSFYFILMGALGICGASALRHTLFILVLVMGVHGALIFAPALIAVSSIDITFLKHQCWGACDWNLLAPSFPSNGRCEVICGSSIDEQRRSQLTRLGLDVRLDAGMCGCAAAQFLLSILTIVLCAKIAPISNRLRKIASSMLKNDPFIARDEMILLEEISMERITKKPEIFGCALNLVGLVAVIYGNPRMLAHYRRYLIVYQVYSLVTDLAIGGLALPILAFPDTGGFSIGILTDFGISTEIQLTIGIYLVGALFGAKIVIFLERQQAALHQEHPFRLCKIAHEWATKFLYIGPILLSFAVSLMCALNDVKKAIKSSSLRYPQLQQFISNPNYFGFQDGFDTAIALILFLLVLVAGALIGFTTLPSFHAFRTQQLMLSEKTVRMQKKWLQNLCIQTLVLCAMVFTPLFYGLFTYFTQQIWLAGYSIWATVIFSQQGAAMTTLNFVLFKSYRKFVKRRVFGIVYGKQKTTQLALESLSVFVVTRNAVTMIPGIREINE
ncbi:unnamed protein product, partial [Mesorhabditis belari]|uniref:G protein-coupled receptor n=1 Tax=Mesorhabditis belari TaxID=2138241 RepID=A0AAF3JA85_9BILA